MAEKMIRENQSLQQYNTFRVPATARWFACPQNEEELFSAIHFAKQQSIPILILGEGSNILFTEDFPGLVLKPAFQRIELYPSDSSSEVFLFAEAGCSWHTLVEYATARNLWGIENLALIPGTVGAAPVQNIGAYGVEFRDVVLSVHAYSITDGILSIFTPEDCEFSYRNSIFKRYPDRWVILSVLLRLQKSPQPRLDYPDLIPLRSKSNLSPKEIMNAVIQIRQSKLPNPHHLPNAGSFFKNPILSLAEWEKLKSRYPTLPGFHVDTNQIKVPAAWLIEYCGWKGYRCGDVGVAASHALVLVNYGNATGAQILALAHHIQQSVFNEFGIWLEPEVRIL